MNNSFTEIRVEIYVEKSILLRDNYSEDGKIISIRDTIESIDEFLEAKGNTYIKEAKNNKDNSLGTTICNRGSQNERNSENHTAKSHKFGEKSIAKRRVKNTCEEKNISEKRNSSESDVQTVLSCDSLVGRDYLTVNLQKNNYVFQSLGTTASENIQQLLYDISENTQQLVIDTTENTQQLLYDTSDNTQQLINDTTRKYSTTSSRYIKEYSTTSSRYKKNVRQLVHDTTENVQQLVHDTTESSEFNESSDYDGSSSGFFSDDEMEFDDGINERIKYSKLLNCKHRTKHVSKRRSVADNFYNKTKSINKGQRVLKNNAVFNASQHQVQSIVDSPEQTHKVQFGSFNFIRNLDNMIIQETCLDTMNYILDHIECECIEDKKYELRLGSSRSCPSKRRETSTDCSTGVPFVNNVDGQPTNIESNEIVTNFQNKKSLLIKNKEEQSKCKTRDIKREIDDLEPGEIRDEVDSTKKDKHKTSAQHGSNSLKRYLLTRRGSKYISTSLRYSSRYIRGRYSRVLRGRPPYRGRSQSYRSLSRGRSLPIREHKTNRSKFDWFDYSSRRGVDYLPNESTTNQHDLRNKIEANERRPYSTDGPSFRSLRPSLYRDRNYSRYGTLQHMRKPYESVSDYIRKYRTFESKCESPTPSAHYRLLSNGGLQRLESLAIKNLTITRRFSTGDERSNYTQNEKRNYRSHSEYFETSPHKYDRYISDESRRKSPGQREERDSKERTSTYKRERNDYKKEEREYDRKESMKHEKQVSNEWERNSSRKSVSRTDSLKGKMSEQVQKNIRINRHSTDEKGTSPDEQEVRVLSVVTIAPSSQQDLADNITVFDRRQQTENNC
ncbi:unnamed protein product [Mytilus coruscus]|uniref:Uncharacterized protein n=1 Tax=Mytilus coruscus TaxID=42192 RepID=A0A6J8EJN3_MYTCO|nr:unnamed protein product [Mytilus coruscus]